MFLCCSYIGLIPAPSCAGSGTGGSGDALPKSSRRRPRQQATPQKGRKAPQKSAASPEVAAPLAESVEAAAEAEPVGVAPTEEASTLAASITGLVDMEAQSTKTTPIKSPPPKKGRQEEPAEPGAVAEASEAIEVEESQKGVVDLNSLPTLRLDDCHLQQELFPDRQPDMDMEMESPDPMESASLGGVTFKAWLHSLSFSDMMMNVISDPNMSVDHLLLHFASWPVNLSKAPLEWVLQWKSNHFQLPFPWKISEGEDSAEKNGVIDLQSQVVADLIAKAKEQTVQWKVFDDRACKIMESIAEMETSKLESLKQRQNDITQGQLNKSCKSIQTWAETQRKRVDAQSIEAYNKFLTARDHAVEEMIRLVSYMAESLHRVQEVEVDEDNDEFVEELSRAFDEQLQKLICEEKKDVPGSGPESSLPSAPTMPDPAAVVASIPKPSEAAELKASEASEPKPSEAAEPKAAEASEPKPTEAAEPKPSDAAIGAGQPDTKDSLIHFAFLRGSYIKHIDHIYNHIYILQHAYIIYIYIYICAGHCCTDGPPKPWG